MRMLLEGVCESCKGHYMLSPYIVGPPGTPYPCGCGAVLEPWADYEKKLKEQEAR